MINDVLDRMIARDFQPLPSKRFRSFKQSCECSSKQENTVTFHFIENDTIESCLIWTVLFSDRHTSENLAEKLPRLAKQWQVENNGLLC